MIEERSSMPWRWRRPANQSPAQFSKGSRNPCFFLPVELRPEAPSSVGQSERLREPRGPPPPPAGHRHEQSSLYTLAESRRTNDTSRGTRQKNKISPSGTDHRPVACSTIVDLSPRRPRLLSNVLNPGGWIHASPQPNNCRSRTPLPAQP